MDTHKAMALKLNEFVEERHLQALYQIELINYLEFCSKTPHDMLLPWPPPPYPEWKECHRRYGDQHDWERIFTLMLRPDLRAYKHLDVLTEGMDPHHDVTTDFLRKISHISRVYSLRCNLSLIDRGTDDKDSILSGEGYTVLWNKCEGGRASIRVTLSTDKHQFFDTIRESVVAALKRISEDLNYDLDLESLRFNIYMNNLRAYKFVTCIFTLAE
jgi:hypothetical protein